MASATVAEMRKLAIHTTENEYHPLVMPETVNRWADELEEIGALAIDMTKISNALKEKLEAAQQRSADLEERLTASFDREIKLMLKSRQASQPTEVDWEALGEAGYEFDCTLMSNPNSDGWANLDEGTRANYIDAAKAVIAAYEAIRNPAQSGGTDGA